MGWYEDYPDNWDKIRKAVYKRDGYACQQCGRRGGPFGNAELQCHHITPKSEGGSHHPRNLQTLCWRCHNAEHDHHIQRMSNLSGTPRSREASSSGSSQPTVSPGFDPSSMDAETEQLRDIFMGVSRQEETTDTEQTGSVDTGSSTDDDKPDWEQRATEYTCPNCDEVIQRTGWFGMYHHFVDCELPAERPPPLSEKQWKMVQEKVEHPTTSSSQPAVSEDAEGDENVTEYDCPNCNVVLSRTEWVGMYEHFIICELPSERPPPLSEEQWEEVQEKVEQAAPSSSNGSSSEPTTVADFAGSGTSSTSPTNRGGGKVSTRNRIGTVSIFYIVLWISSLHLTEWLGVLFPVLLVGGTASHIGYVWYTQNPSDKSQAWMVVGLSLVIISMFQYIWLYRTAVRVGIPAWEAYQYGSFSVFTLMLGHLAMRKGMLANYTV